MNTLAEVQEKAAEMELYGADFLNKKGEIAKKPRYVRSVRLTFIDGVQLNITRELSETPEFGAIEFKLRPSRGH